MSGLIEKDLRLLLLNGKILPIYFLMLVFFGAMSEDNTFVVGYLTVMGAMLAIGTISYDEQEKGMAFLMTLPVDAKTYAVEKHLFSGMVLVASWAVSVILQTVISMVRGVPTPMAEGLTPYVMTLLVFLMLISVYTPLQLKFGMEKCKVVLLVLAVSGAGITIMGEKLSESASFGGLQKLSAALSAVSEAAWLGIAFAVVAAGLGIAVLCSIRIMQKKEY